MSEHNGNGRDERGLFVKGNTAARGNPNSRRMHELRRSLLEAASEADVRELYAALMKSAREGDVPAAKVLLDHLVGRPMQAVEVSAPDGSTIDLATIAAVVLSVCGEDQAVRIRLAAEFARLGGGRDGMGG